MTQKEAYQRVAERAIDASEALIADGIQEKAAFMAYHAFESTGCALSKHFKLPVGPNVSHVKKIRHFTTAAKRLNAQKPVVALAISLNGMRNSLLYPAENPNTGAIRTPEKVITISQANKLKKRVNGIVKWVRKQL